MNFKDYHKYNLTEVSKVSKIFYTLDFVRSVVVFLRFG